MSINFIYRFVFSLVVAPLVLLFIYIGGVYFNLLIFLIFILGTYEIIILKNLITKIFIFIIFIFFIYSISEINKINNGKFYLFYVLFVTWLSDIGGYVTGKIFGGKKIGVISPNKTYNGICGSIFFSQFIIVYLYYFKLFFFEFIFYNLIVIFLSSIAVIIGDLFFSYLKRINNIKDYSNLLIGHGGLFDRIDGLIFLVIFFNIFVNIL